METKKYATIKEIVEYGLNEVDETQLITMNLKDFLYVFRVLSQYMRYFHNLDHYPTLDAVKELLGSASSGGAFDVLDTAFYQKMYAVTLPAEIAEMFDDGKFEHPLVPKYYSVAEPSE